MRRAAILLLALALAGCGSYWEGASARDVATLTLYRAERKVLVFLPVGCSVDHGSKPAMVSEWVRESDIGRMTVNCDADCNCRMVKVPRAPKVARATR